MASPNWDALSIQHSRNIGDYVAAATTDGKVWSSAQRDNHLNIAHRRWLGKWVDALKNKNPEAGVALRSYRNREGQALTNNSKALSGWTGGVHTVLSAYNSTDGVLVRRLPDGYTGVARAGQNTYFTPSTTNQFYQEEAGNFILLDGGTTTADTIVLEYIKKHTALAANDAGAAGDTLVPDDWWPEILSLALKVAVEEDAELQMFQVGAVKEAEVERDIRASEMSLG